MKTLGITRLLFVSTIAVYIGFGEAETADNHVPVERYAALPYFTGAQLSPDAETVGYVTTLEGHKHLVIENLYTNETLAVAPPDKAEIQYFRWVSDSHIVLSFDLTVRGFAGRKHRETRLFSLSLETQKFRWLGKPPKETNTKVGYLGQFEQLLHMLSNDPQHILVALTLDPNGNPGVYRINVETGGRSVIQTGKNGVQNWYVDQLGQPRLGTGYRNNEWTYLWRNGEKDWTRSETPDWVKKYSVKGFSPNQEIAYVGTRNEHGREAIYSLHIPSGQIVNELVSHKEYDVSYLKRHPATGQVIGASYYDDFEQTTYFDSNFKNLQGAVNSTLKGNFNQIVSKAANKEIYLVLSQNVRTPGTYYLFNLEKQQVSPLVEVMASLPADQMAPTMRTRFNARDGQQIPGYLTVPTSYQKGQSYPTVIMPHGGPQARDTAEWDYWAQFYANRGYVVYKPNFRGSEGFGYRFERAGKLQWGGLMQDDVTDATHWLIDQGIADPKRICIVGASYGGYAAIMGTIMEQGLYACAVSVNGVTDLPALKTHDKGFIGGKNWIQNMGHKTKDDKDVSPYHLAKGVSAPILLLSSKDDARIPYKHSRALYKKLKGLKKDSAYVRIKNGGHAMDTENARMALLKETEKFLAKHIGPNS